MDVGKIFRFGGGRGVSGSHAEKRKAVSDLQISLSQPHNVTRWKYPEII